MTDEIPKSGHPFDNCWVRCGPSDIICLGNPDINKVNYNYIVTTLAGQNRFLGYTNETLGKRVSVLEHSMYVFKNLVRQGFKDPVKDSKLLRTALAHDFTEAYSGDIISPIKAVWGDYKIWEDKIMWPILATKFDLLDPIPEEVKEADRVVREIEMDMILRSKYPSDDVWSHNVPPEAVVRYFNKYWDALK